MTVSITHSTNSETMHLACFRLVESLGKNYPLINSVVSIADLVRIDWFEGSAGGFRVAVCKGIKQT